MSHNLNYNAARGTFSMYSRKEVPWHGLGQFITEAETAEHALKLANLDFEVKLGDVYCNFVPRGSKVINIKDANKIIGYEVTTKDGEKYNLTNKGARIDGQKAIYRDDTKEVFSLVTDAYEIVQNYEALDIIYNVIKGPDVTDRNQITIETAGCLNKGETIFVTAKLPSYMVNTKKGGKDPVDRYIVFTSSHNKSAMITGLITDIRVVCNNTLQMALQGRPNKVSLRHTRNVRDKFDQFAEMLGVANKYSKGAQEVLEHLSQYQVTGTIVRDYIVDVFAPSDKIQLLKSTVNWNMLSVEEVSTRLKNKLKEVRDYIDVGPGQEFDRGSLYWLYNGATSYMHNGIDFKTGDNKFSKILGGSTSNDINKAYNKILEYAK